MIRNIFDPQKGEPYLTAFGKQVLQVMMETFINDNNGRDDRTNYGESTFYRKNSTRALTFVDESLSTLDGNTYLSPPIQIYSTENVFNTASNVLSTTSNKKRIETLHDVHDARNDDSFLHPTVISNNKIKERLNKEFKDEHQVLSFKNINKKDDNFRQKGTIANVSWDNMFDSDLCNFDDLGADNRNNPSSNIISHKENSSNTFSDILDQDINIKQGEKRKNGNDKIKCKMVKKTKIPEETCKDFFNTNKLNNDVAKPIFRKQKYTTTVKTWLHDINSYNDNDSNNTPNDLPNVEDIGDLSSIDKLVIQKEQEINTKKDNTKYKITIDKTVKCTKKVVQSRLANKDGIMKYSKPILDNEPKMIEEINNKTSKDKKEKVAKQFHPPIKSQIPVKDITYKIVIVDENNTNGCCAELSLNISKKVIAILIYSNDFCQLNSHFTEDACAAEGILLSNGDQYFYLKGSGQNIRNIIGHILENNTIITYEAGKVLIYLASHLQMDISKTNVYDAKIGASLLDPDNPPENFSDLQKLLSLTAPYTIATECKLQKAAWYMCLLDECWSKLKEQLVQSQLWKVFVEIEMKLLPIISEMERRGVAIDVSKLKSMEEVLLARMKLVEQECYKTAKKVFQINSTVQVRSILYDELQLDTKHNVKITETLSKGVKSTSETMLRSLISVHPLPKLILEYRHLHKAHATFLAGIAQHVKDGIVKPTWVQTAAATGRIASNNPNLQAIPKVPFSLVMFPDADHNDAMQVKFRSVYIPRAGCSLLAADFQHVECRVFAHMAADSSLLSALARPDDLFRVLAALWLKIPEDRVSPGDRERTKRLVYASLYGAGPRKLMEILDVTYDQALQIAASFNRTFPSLKSFGRHVVSRCTEGGGRLATLSGRLRHFAHINSEDFALRAHAHRQAVNFVVQGSAADLCKTAMILTEEHLRNNQPPVEAHLLLQIHDELVWEVKDTHLEIAAGLIKRVMEQCGQKCGMSVSLPVAISVGKNWADMQQYPVAHSQH